MQFHAAMAWGWALSWASKRLQQVIEIGAGEVPVERPGDGVVADFEGSQAVADLVQAGEVVGCKGFALDDGEVDFRLVQPGGPDGQVDQVRLRPSCGHPFDRPSAALRRT